MSDILCIVDGMTDSSFSAESLPNLSKMKIIKGIDTTCGMPPESLGCIMHILGVKDVPQNLRGYAEALGYNIPVQADDLVLRGSWFAVDKNGLCTKPVLAPQTINGSEKCRYYPLEQYKSLLILPDMAHLAGTMQTFPPYSCAGVNAHKLCPKGCPELEKIFNNQLESGLCLVPWGQSAAAEIEKFSKKSAVICGTPIVKGIAKLLGMDLINLKGATGDTDTDLEEKTKCTLNAAENYPFVLLHINGADEAAHRLDKNEKTKFIKQIDTVVISQLINSKHNIYVMADHGTNPKNGRHTNEIQPVYAIKK